MSTYNIIADSVRIVNGSVADFDFIGKSQKKDFSKFERMGELKTRSLVIADKLDNVGYSKRGALMKACNTAIVLRTCAHCGKTHIETTNLCRDRLCPVCGYLLSVKRYNQMQKTLKGVDISKYQWRFMTLTIKNCSIQNLGFTITRMLKAWDKLCRRVILKDNLKGWARSLEVTYNSETGTFHPHIHILAAFSFVPAPLSISEQWKETLALDYTPICDIEQPYGSSINSPLDEAIAEAFKYCCKSKQVADMPLGAFKALVDGLKNRRLIAFGGVIKAARAAAGIVEDDTAETVIEKNCCGETLGEIIYRWSFADKAYKCEGVQ